MDTSFLITFANPQRPHHEAAMRYFRECVQRQVPMYLSSIVISELQVKQAINDLPLRNFVVLPFNADHAMSCGLLMRQLHRDAGDDRVRIKDDFKLIAQCDCEGITHLLTEDAGILVKYVEKVLTGGQTFTQPVLLKDGFDIAWFDNGQRPLLSGD